MSVTAHCSIPAKNAMDQVSACCCLPKLLHAMKKIVDSAALLIISEKMIREVFGARMRVTAGEGGVPQCMWDF